MGSVFLYPIGFEMLVTHELEMCPAFFRPGAH